MWSEEKFDALVQESVRCDHPFQLGRKKIKTKTSDQVFTRLMLVKAAMRWLSGESRGGVLLPTDTVEVQLNGVPNTINVMDALRLKHPCAKQPHSSTLMDSDLPPFEDIDVTGSHVETIAHRIQGSGGPGGCDSSHWRDVLIRFL